MEAASVIEALSYEAPKAFPAPPKPRLIASRPDPLGNVAVIMAEIMEPGRGKVEIADVFAAYAEACEAAGKRPIPANEFPDAIAIGKGANETDPNGRAAKEFAELFTWLKENVK